jgi:glycosyltransferase involved in cell wall biosynthesis
VPIYSADPRCGLLKRAFVQSPLTVIETDAVSADVLPAEVRAVASSINFGGANSLASFSASKVPQGSDSVVTWLAGDVIVEGSAATIRHDLRTPGRRVFVPVHVPCLDDAPLVAIQPRWFRCGPAHDYWNFTIRVQSAAIGSRQALSALKANSEPWARLAGAVLAEGAKSGAGVAVLVSMWEQRDRLPAMLAALALRNLVVLMVRYGENAKAQQLLALGMTSYSGYAELFYLAALFAIYEHRFAQALPFLEKTKSREGGFLGSGGESSYRADWLLGLLAARVGNHRVAFGRFLTGLTSTPVFLPAVEELLNLRLPPRMIEAHQYDLCRAVRREPKLLDKVFSYLLLHRAFDSAQRIIRTISMGEQHRARFEDQLASARSAFLPDRHSQSAKTGIMFCGPLFEHTSLARINRELALGLMPSQQLDLCLEPSSPSAVSSQTLAGGESLTAALLQHPAQLDLTIRHQWPPDFRRPPRGKLVVIVPWEYGAVPRVWVEQIESNVDELWVPSGFVRDTFLRGGVRADRVVVIPNGVDTKVFTPDGPPLRPQGARKFVFLFVGGAIRRKGVDLLLEAYKTAFDPGEDVSLILAMSGVTGAYQHNSLLPQIERAANDSGFPHLQPLFDCFDDATLASLYRGCDAFALPYRGEGFGMPLLEAMACGKPAITTALGPSTDFCSGETTYLVAAHEEEVPEEPPPLGPLTGKFTWFEPDFAELVRTLRHVYENRGEAAQRGRTAAKYVCQEFSWARVTSLYAERIRELQGSSRRA